MLCARICEIQRSCNPSIEVETSGCDVTHRSGSQALSVCAGTMPVHPGEAHPWTYKKPWAPGLPTACVCTNVRFHSGDTQTAGNAIRIPKTRIASGRRTVCMYCRIRIYIDRLRPAQCICGEYTMLDRNESIGCDLRRAQMWDKRIRAADVALQHRCDRITTTRFLAYNKGECPDVSYLWCFCVGGTAPRGTCESHPAANA